MSSPHNEVILDDFEALEEHLDHLAIKFNADTVIKYLILYIQQKRDMMDTLDLKRRMKNAT